MQTVGELLRSEREKKGLSLKEIEAAISIRVLYINAIEEGNYEIVPGEVYLKGFIRNYANFLGLDGKKMVDAYREAQAPRAPEPSMDTPTVQESPVVRKIKRKNSSKLVEVIIILLCVAGAAWWLFGTSNNVAKEPQGNLQAQTTPVAPTPLPVPSVPITPSTPATPVQTKPVIVVAKYSERCWTSVTADGKQIYEGTPQSGETLTWEAQKNITLTVGNAGAVDITSNGKSLGKIGGKGEVVVKSFAGQP